MAQIGDSHAAVDDEVRFVGVADALQLRKAGRAKWGRGGVKEETIEKPGDFTNKGIE